MQCENSCNNFSWVIGLAGRIFGKTERLEGKRKIFSDLKHNEGKHKPGQ
jgi:hypothetical protein